jgi:predicted RNase H-like HicB family nuclease
MEYTAIIEQGKNGWYVAQCAQIPGAVSQGKSADEAEENLKDAIRLILECEREETLKTFRPAELQIRQDGRSYPSSRHCE